MNIGGLVGALVPVFFVLALGFFAGKRNAFDTDQAAGLSKLAVSYALPASLFVGMSTIPRDLLLQQGRLVLALILSHAGLFLAAWACLRLAKTLNSTAAIIYALMLSTSATPVFGLAVLQPLLGPTSAGAVGLVALAINLTVPPAVILLEMDAASKRQILSNSTKNLTAPLDAIPIQVDAASKRQILSNSTKNLTASPTVMLLEMDPESKQHQIASSAAKQKQNPILSGIKAGLQSPLLWAPILGIAIVLVGYHLPKVLASSFELIGSATSGVAVFAVGLVLAAHPISLSRAVLIGTLGRITVQSAVLFALVHFLHVISPFAREALVCCSFPLATVVVLFAARYKSSEAESASMLLFSTLALAVTVPVMLWLSR
jgi:predicted permease